MVRHDLNPGLGFICGTVNNNSRDKGMVNCMGDNLFIMFDHCLEAYLEQTQGLKIGPILACFLG